MRWLVRLVSRPGEVILDAFAGSATTLAAAILEGRDALGIEDDPESWPYGHGRLRRISPPRKSLCMHTGRIAAVYRADEEEGERPR
jgi:DNA modification methylase